MFDIVSYIMGLIRGEANGTQHVVLKADGYTFTDPENDGNIVIEEASE